MKRNLPVYPKEHTSAKRCRYCDQPTVQVSGYYVYLTFGHKRYNTSNRRDSTYTACLDCGAFVSHHSDGRPMGGVAILEDRRLRRKAHQAFDPIWKIWSRRGKSPFKARKEAYKWLSDRLAIPPEYCHIGKLWGVHLERVILVCEGYLRDISKGKWVDELEKPFTFLVAAICVMLFPDS